MATGDLFNPKPYSQTVSKVKLLTMFRLGLFQMGLGIMSILTLGVESASIDYSWNAGNGSVCSSSTGVVWADVRC